MPDKNFNRLGFLDLLKAIEASPKPVIVVLKQNYSARIKGKNGLSGGNMTTAMQTLGCVGVVSDGPSRDMGDIRGMEFQYLLTGVCAGHGDLKVEAVNIPVSVCGMDVAPGDIAQMDFDRYCHNLDAFDVGGNIIEVDTTDFRMADFEHHIKMAQEFFKVL